MNTVTIGTTTKGRRVWLQGITSHMPHVAGLRYDVEYTHALITIVFSATGKRKLCASKGGIVDLVGAQVTTWAQHYNTCKVKYGEKAIVIIVGAA